MSIRGPIAHIVTKATNNLNANVAYSLKPFAKCRHLLSFLTIPYSDFMAHEFKDGEIVAFGCSRGELALVAGVTNKGKSTLMRVIAMCAASGRGFPPFVAASSEGLRVVLMDYEGSASRTQADLRLMEQNLTENEKGLLEKNLFVCHAPRVKGEV